MKYGLGSGNTPRVDINQTIQTPTNYPSKAIAKKIIGARVKGQGTRVNQERKLLTLLDP